MPRSFLYLFVLLAAALAAGAATAADIKVMISAGFFNVYADLGPAFEKLTGHKLITTRGPSVGDSPEAIPTRLTRGEGADVVIMDGTGVELLDQRGMTRPGTHAARGVVHRHGGSSGSAQARHQHGRGDAKDTPRRE